MYCLEHYTCALLCKCRFHISVSENVSYIGVGLFTEPNVILNVSVLDAVLLAMR